MAEQHKDPTNRAASDVLPEGVAPRKKSNVRFAFACAILASMTSILLGYGTYILFVIHLRIYRCLIDVSCRRQLIKSHVVKLLVKYVHDDVLASETVFMLCCVRIQIVIKPSFLFVVFIRGF